MNKLQTVVNNSTHTHITCIYIIWKILESHGNIREHVVPGWKQSGDDSVEIVVAPIRHDDWVYHIKQKHCARWFRQVIAWFINPSTIVKGFIGSLYHKPNSYWNYTEEYSSNLANQQIPFNPTKLPFTHLSIVNGVLTLYHTKNPPGLLASSLASRAAPILGVDWKTLTRIDKCWG